MNNIEEIKLFTDVNLITIKTIKRSYFNQIDDWIPESFTGRGKDFDEIAIVHEHEKKGNRDTWFVLGWNGNRLAKIWFDVYMKAIMKHASEGKSKTEQDTFYEKTVLDIDGSLPRVFIDESA